MMTMVAEEEEVVSVVAEEEDVMAMMVSTPPPIRRLDLTRTLGRRDGPSWVERCRIYSEAGEHERECANA